MTEELKAWCQQHHCEALAQLSVHEDSRSALVQHPSVMPALEAVAKKGLTPQAREFAMAALVALRETKLHMKVDGQKHVMLSCELIPMANHGFHAHRSLTSVLLYGACRSMECASDNSACQCIADCTWLRDLV